MSELPTHPARLITDSKALKDVIERLRGEPVVGLDTESNGFHRYPERVCLVQLASRDENYLVDPLAVADMSPLGLLLTDRRVRKVLHSADYDLRCLDREWSFRFENLYDTSIAAHFAGLDRLGLAASAERFLGVTLNKDKRLQRADWSLRPLSKAALEYAAADTAYLLPLRDAIEKSLASLGRSEWALEESRRMEQIRYVAPEPPEVAYLSMKGSKALDGRGLAVLRRLVMARDQEARRLDRPPFRVLGNQTLLHLAADPGADLTQTPGLGAPALRRMGNRIRKAIQEGLADEPVKRPPRPHPAMPRPTADDDARLSKLRAWRNERAAELSLDPALIWPMISLDRLAREPGSIDRELASGDVRRWQANRFARSLRPLLAKR